MYRILHDGVHYGEPATIQHLGAQLKFFGWEWNDGEWTLQAGGVVLRARLDFVPEQKSFSQLPKAPGT